MKKLIFLLIMNSFLSLQCYSQLKSTNTNKTEESGRLEVISPCGTTFKNDNLEISFTIGELAIETLNNNGAVLTEGFHQTKLLVTEISQINLNDWQLTVFPNPTSQSIIIENHSNSGNLNLNIYDFAGRNISKHNFSATETKFDMKNFVSGTYLFQFFTNDKQKSKTFKIIKK